jgi:hypothetical protein
MPEYVTKMLQRFRPQYLLSGHRAAKTPGRYIPPSYTSTPQVVFVDTTEKLNPTLFITELQAIIGTLLYYARAVDPTLLTIANELASQQIQQTQRVLKAANRVLSYCSTNHHNALIYHACDMTLLHAFADASYLCLSITLPIRRRRYIFPRQQKRSHQNKRLNSRILDDKKSVRGSQRKRSRIRSFIRHWATRSIPSDNSGKHGLSSKPNHYNV